MSNATTTNLTSITSTGDTNIDNVRLSAAVTSSNIATIDFVDDTAADVLILNTADSSNWTTFNSDGSIAGGASTFTFNKFNNFDGKII